MFDYPWLFLLAAVGVFIAPAPTKSFTTWGNFWFEYCTNPWPFIWANLVVFIGMVVHEAYKLEAAKQFM